MGRTFMVSIFWTLNPSLDSLKSMKIILFILAALVILASFASTAYSQDSAVWGRVVTVDRTSKSIPYKYYVYYEEKGVSHAYPLDVQSGEMIELVKKNLNQSVRIEGKTKEITLENDGIKQKHLLFLPTKIIPLTLSQLAVNDSVDMNSTAKAVGAKKERVPTGGGIQISDRMANGLLMTGGAVMLGTLLYNKFK